MGTGAVAIVVGSGTGPSVGASPAPTFLQGLNSVTQVGSTVPANGDVNPYGVALVRQSVGKLVSGDTLVSNYNSKANVQGTGTTIVEVAPSGKRQLFSQISPTSPFPPGSSCPGGIGLTTALGVLPGGWVVVGSLASQADGAITSARPAGCLIVLNSQGAVDEAFSSPEIDGPWDMQVEPTAAGANIFLANALGGDTKTTSKGVPVAGNCTITRLELSYSGTSLPVLSSSTVIGQGFPWEANKAAFVLAPTGLALSFNGTLFVDNTLTNTVAAMPDAVDRTTAVSAAATTISTGGHLNAPLGMVLAPDGNLLVVNGNNGDATEVTPSGKQVATKTLVKNGAGDLFGLSLTANGKGILFVNDGTNSLDRAQHRT
jgi:hypothetical protein